MTVLSANTVYDHVPYPCYAYWFTHPDNLFTIASLLGLSPTSVDKCRVLELGCANGGNLIPMAFQLPESRFVGIDLSSQQIADGLERISCLGLANVELFARDILDITTDIGCFDYIICHGVFSWVPDLVRERIFDICHQQLTENGVALISYNVYPGWHQGEQLRDMLRYHTSAQTDPHERIKSAKRLLHELARVATEVGTSSWPFFREELSKIEDLDDEYLFYEYLEGENRPLYFHQFAAQAESFGLRCVGSAWRGRMSMDDQHPSVAEALVGYTDPIEVQQYLDFFTNARFRASLLARSEQNIGQDLTADTVYQAYLRAYVEPDPMDGDLASREPIVITTPTGETAQIWGPSVRIALSILTEHSPAALPFEELLLRVVERLVEGGFVDPVRSGKATDQTKPELAADLTGLYLANIVHFHCRDVRVTNEVSDCPSATRLAMLEAERGATVTNQWHEAIVLDPFFRAVVRHLDGKRDVAALADALERAIQNGELQAPHDWSKPMQSDALVRAVSAVLVQLMQDALLVG